MDQGPPPQPSPRCVGGGSQTIRLTPGPVRVTHAPHVGSAVAVEPHSRFSLLLRVLEGCGFGVRLETLAPASGDEEGELEHWVDIGAFGPYLAGGTLHALTLRDAFSYVRYRVTTLGDGAPPTIDIQGDAHASGG